MMKSKHTLFCYLKLLLLGALFWTSCKNKPAIQPAVGIITESVYASGKVKAAEQYKVFSTVAGTLQQKHVQIGEIVKKGDPIFTVKNQVAELSVSNSRLAVRQVEENMKKIRDMKRQVDLLCAKFLQDSLMYVRQRNLWEQQATSQVQFEQAVLAMKSSKMEYTNLLSQLEQTKTALQLEYKAAKNNVKISEENAGGYIVRSETSGKIYTIYPEEGEGISPQTLLAIIGKPDQFLIEIEVDENDIASVQTGQEILITMDSYKDSVFKATVTSIHPILNENSGTFTVEGAFTHAPPQLYPYMNVEANILTGRKENAMVIPRDYLTEDNCVLVDNGKKLPVKVGLKNYEYVEIISGLSKDQKIYKP
jgi:HlyD family secretion protein